MAEYGGGGAGSSAPGDKVSVNGADTTSGFLAAKLSAGAGVSLTVLNPGGNEQLQISNSPAGQTFIIRADLAALTSQDSAAFPNGCQAYAVSAAQTGKWYRKSRAYVVGNYTLWCQSYGFGVVGFGPGQQAATSSAEPEIQLNMTALIDNLGNQQGVITDSLNNVWFTVNGGSFTKIDIYKFSLSKCLASGTPTPDLNIPILLTGGEQSESAIALFDRVNNALWVADGNHGGIGQTRMRVYGPRAYTSVPSKSSLSILANNPALNSNQQDAVFDGLGNMWCSVAVSTGGSNGGILMFSAAQLVSGGTVAPAVGWFGSNFTGPGLGATCNMAIGPDNLLWVANFSGSNNVQAWDMTNPVSGNPAPAIVLTSASFNGPYAVSFDPAGNLWVNNGNVNGLMRIPKAQLAASGVVVPDVILTPPVAALTSKFTFPNNPDRVGLLPSGAPITQ